MLWSWGERVWPQVTTTTRFELRRIAPRLRSGRCPTCRRDVSRSWPRVRGTTGAARTLAGAPTASRRRRRSGTRQCAPGSAPRTAPCATECSWLDACRVVAAAAAAEAARRRERRVGGAFRQRAVHIQFVIGPFRNDRFARASTTPPRDGLSSCSRETRPKTRPELRVERLELDAVVRERVERRREDAKVGALPETRDRAGTLTATHRYIDCPRTGASRCQLQT